MRTKFAARTPLEPGSFGPPRGLTAVLAGLISLFSGAVSAAIVTSTWNGATDGNWNVDARWTNVPLMAGFPNNGNAGVATYDAVINAVGAAYTVTLGTSITIEDLTLDSANATLNHTAGIFAATGAIALSAGTYQLNGGTISNTTINVSGAGSLVIGTNINNLLTGVTVNGDLNLTAINAATRIGAGTSFATAHLANQSSEIGFLAGATMNGTILLEGVGGGTRFIGMSTAGAVTIGATGVIRTNIGLGGNAQIGAGNQYFAAMALTNNGLISSEVSGRTITINAGTSFANSGNLAALNGGILTITTAGWTNTGTIAVGPGSVVNLGPLNATGGIGTFNNTGGTVNISGTLNNTGNTILLNNTTGSWTLAGGTLSGGTVNFADGTSLLINTNINNLLTGVTVNGDLNLTAINAATRIGAGTSFATAHLANQSSEIGFLAGATMNGTILLEGAGGGTRFIGMSTAGAVTIGATGVIRTNTGLGGNAQIGGGNQYFAAMALTNNGLISSEVSARTININAGSLTNAATGTLSVSNGGILTIAPTGAWTNSGTIALSTAGIVNLGGTFDATGGIGTWSNTGGTVNITGTLNAGSGANALTLNASTGSWTLAGGTLSGGTVNFADGTSLLINTNINNLLTGVTVNGDLNLTAINAATRIGAGTSFATAHLANQSSEIGFLAGATMNGTILLEGAGGGTRFIGMSTAGAVTIGATGVIRTNTGLGGNAQIGGGNQYFAAMALTNNGLISSEVSARTININAGSLTNAATGTLSVSNGGILTIAPTGAWTNSGTIALSTAGIVNLGGTFDATGGIGTWSNTGGTVNITGTLNAGSGANALTLNASTGSWTLAGGTLSGGTVNFADGTSLLINTNINNLLTGVTVNGDLNLTAINAATRIGAGTSFATAHLANQSSEIGFLAGATMNGTILLEGAGGGTRFIGMSTAGAVTIGATGVIRTNTGLGGNAQIGGGNNYFAAMALTNNGLISSQVGGRTIGINAGTSFANSGNLAALNGGILTISTAGWTNTGTIAVGPGSVVNLGPFNATGGIGTFNNTGGTVNINGTLDNTGNTILLNNSTGSWTMAGGTLSGGTVNFADGTSLLINTNASNLLTGVTVNGDLNLTAINAATRIGAGTSFATAHLANQSSEIGFLAGATMNGTILLEGAGGGTRFIGISTAGAVTIGATGVIRSNTGLGGNAQIGAGNQYFAAMTLTNNGLISSQVSGRTITINAASFTNRAPGLVEATNGGILTIPSGTTLTNYDSATETLTDGSWIVGTGSTLTLNRSGNLLLNAADITLSGSGSVFRAGTTATTIESTLTGNSGALRIMAGRNYSNANALNNSGVLQLGGGTFAATTLTNAAAGEVFGFGTISIRPLNSGLIRSSGGVLILSAGTGNGGTVQIDAGSSLDLSPSATGSSANVLTHNGTATGSLNLGAQNFTVDGDYSNANFGVGNTFDLRANVVGAGQIVASGPIAQSLSGDVTGGATATPSLTFPNVHVGDVVTRNYKINNVGVLGARLRGAIQTSVNGGNLTDTRLSGSGVTASNFGPIPVGTGTSDLAVTLNATTAGALSGQTVRILNNFENVGDQTLSIVGAAYRFANPTTHMPEPVNLGNFHVGDPAPSQALTVMNNLPNDGFSESLNASIGGFTGGVTGSGSFNQLAPAATNNTSLIVGISTATGGSKNGTATISLVSDGIGSSGLGTTALTAQTVNVTGAVYRLALASAHTPEPVNFGTVRVGTSLQQVLTVSNTAANDGFSERLSGSLSGATGSATATGSFTLLAAGASDSTSLLIGLITATPGAKTGTATLNLTSDGTGTSDLGQSTLTAQTVNVQGTVNALANPVFAKASGDGALSGSTVTFTLEFGVLAQGAPTQIAQLRLDNFVVAPADALGGSYTLAAPNFDLSGFGTFNNLAPGSAISGLSVSFAPSALGNFNGSVTFAALSQNGSQTDQALGNYVLNLHAQVIPEPSALGLLAIGFLDFARRRRRELACQ